jgi:hypothetical protein
VIFIFICSLTLCGCISPSPSIKKRSIIQDSRIPITRQPEEKRITTRIVFTFLDTINYQNELRLTEDDFEKDAKTTESALSEAALPESLYRIQVFASNRIETVRAQKKELEKSTEEPVIIGYEAPYYKLFAGGFNKKQDAQSILLKLKRIGYVDAWIVSTKAIP